MLERAATGDRLLHVLTLNPEQVMAARHNRGIATLIESADLVTADGVGITLALALQGARRVDRVTGVRLMTDLAALGVPTFFLGGRPGAAEEALRRVSASAPTARVVGAWSGGQADTRDDAQSLRRIRESGALAVLVAFGAPAQNEWIERNRRALEDAGVRIAIGIGGALDYAAGLVPTAPGWVSAGGFEWLYRLVREPWRWRRQLVLPGYAILAGLEALRVRANRL